MYDIFEIFHVPTVYSFFLLVSAVITYALLPSVIRIIKEAEFVRPNYQDEPIPLGGGLVFLISALLTVVAAVYFLDERLRYAAVIYLMVLAVSTCLGLVDDAWGSRASSGFKGHFSGLFKGRLTTGTLKAVGVGLTALTAAIAVDPDPLGWIPVNALLIALSANAINLLDLRPGRAGKGFLILAAIMFFAGWGSHLLVFLALTVGSLFVFLRDDLAARVMMGDAGANALGGAVGLTAIWVLSPPVKIILLVSLFLLHLFAERYSITAVIAGSNYLSFFDRLGRKL